MSRKALKKKVKENPPYSGIIRAMGPAEARIVPPEEVEARKRAAAMGQPPPGMAVNPGMLPGQAGPPPSNAPKAEPLFRDHVAPERKSAGMGNVSEHRASNGPLPQRTPTHARPSNTSMTPPGIPSNVQSVVPAHHRPNFVTQQQPAQPIQTSVQVHQPPQAAQTVLQVRDQAPQPTQPVVAIPQPVPEIPVVGVTAIISTAFRPAFLRPQLGILLENSVVAPAAVWVWASFDGHPHYPIDIEALAHYRVMAMRCVGSLGPWPRLDIVANVQTPYVLILDDDCFPGPEWLARALQFLEQAGNEEAFVVAFEGARFDSDDPESLRPVAPDVDQAQVVDVGFKGWLAPTEVMQAIATGPRFPSMVGNQLFMGVSGSQFGARTVILPDPPDSRNTWGEIPIDSNAPRLSEMEGAKEALAHAYAEYRSGEWAPLCVAPTQAVEQLRGELTKPDESMAIGDGNATEASEDQE